MTWPRARREVVASSSANTGRAYGKPAGPIAYGWRVLTEDVTKLIEKAIRDRLVLRVTYCADDGTVVEHVVEPLAIRFNRAKHRVLWCWSRGGGHVEELLWDGIEGAVSTGETFVPRPWSEKNRG